MGHHNFLQFTRFIAKYLVTFIASVGLLALPMKVFAVNNPQNSGIGFQATINEPPPSQAATITSPANGAIFSSLPVKVVGWCPNNLLVKIYSNGIFIGSVMCTSSSYSAQVDLFNGRNDLTAIAYDQLDQASPVSNAATVSFNNNTANANIANRVNLTSDYARRGANPGQTLIWPVIISGGLAPYALNVDWGDGTTNDLYSASTAGSFNIQHTYKLAGTYSVLIKAVDAQNTVSYFQVVAVANGQVVEPTSPKMTPNSSITTVSSSSLTWLMAAGLLALSIVAFWLGGRSKLAKIKKSLLRGDDTLGS